VKRVNVDVSNFRGPLDPVPFAGLGAAAPGWPGGRSYWNVSNFRAPYDTGRFNASLMGLGATQVAVPPSALLPPRFQEYLATGAPMRSVVGAVQPALCQIPRWAWALIAAGAGYAAYRAFKPKT
jgi:hypothetical protein